ncbi:E3 ubiquitin-protein ligase Zswim2-like isoform X3 [Rhodnius prolixus]|uniref:E3 ubiquitin-protein ligase Zswim2-like isoform X3 n=1 Tax=Rhodnius prolixus TaxID=13249 RepID=UPI003D18A8C2
MNGLTVTRRICPVEVRTLQRLCTTSRMYLVRQVGPTSWDIAEGNREPLANNAYQQQGLSTVRVSLGSLHQCSCVLFNKTKELCKHLVWILMNKLKLKSGDQLSYQLGMSETQLLRCLEGGHVVKSKSTTKRDITRPACSKAVTRRPISGRDSCPICLESFANKAVMFCKYSCGNAMHTHCMDIVSKHQDLSGSSRGPEVGITCPLCRGFFCTQYELLQELRKPLNVVKPQPKSLANFDMVCSQCDVLPIVGSVYKCSACPQMIVCPSCLKSQAFSVHANHGLLVKTDPNQKWKKTQYPHKWKTVFEEVEMSHLKAANKVILPKIKSNSNKTPSEVTSARADGMLQCPICTNQCTNVVELECGHVIPSPEPAQLIEPVQQQQKSPRPMTGRCMRSPPQPHLPPPQVVVTRAELYARNKPPQYQKGLTYSQKLANITSGKATRKKAGNDKKSSEVPAEEEGEEFSIRENGRLLGSKVLPIMALLLQRKGKQCSSSAVSLIRM